MDEKEYTKSFDLSIWKRLLPILARYKGCIIGVMLLNTLSAAVDVVFPLFQKYAIAHFISAGTLAGLSEVVKPVTPGTPPVAPAAPVKKYHRPVEGDPAKCELGDQ